ncbi:alpha/beta-hydrolase [Astrocystis sublimbata]|nr:alpha/beta-hydrolase [Astrocystis sublimbata]
MATEHALLGAAAQFPLGPSSPIISFTPVIIPSPGRPAELQLRVTAPATGDALPIILLSHGHGLSNWLSSLEGYAPLAEFWAKHGFVVLQPTHLNSKALSLPPAPPGDEMYWKSRPKDMINILDHLNDIESTVPGLKGRLDRSRIACFGHSFGSFTTSLLLGATNTTPADGTVYGPLDKRIKAGIIIGGIGNGGADMSENGRKMLPSYNPDFSAMHTPALVIGGEDDVSPHLTTRGADWHWDAYTLGPGKKDLLRVKGGKHGFGGISGWDAKETQDESPEMLGFVQRMSLAYLKSQMYQGDDSWARACEVLAGLGGLGSVESKE